MIAIVYPQFYGVGGIARYLDSFLSNLPPLHPTIYVITGDELRVEKHYKNVELIHLPFNSNRFNLFFWTLKARKILNELYKQRKIQYVNLHIPPLIPGLLLNKKIPLILTAHTTYIGMSGRFYKTHYFESQWSSFEIKVKLWMELRIFKQATKIITLTEQGKQELLSYGIDKPIEVIPNGVDMSLFNINNQIEKQYDVIFSGRIEVRKGSRAVVDLCKQLIEKKPNIRILIVGYGDDESHVMAKLAPFTQNITFTGKVNFSAMQQFYQQSQLYVSTSYYEGLPGTCLEAMAMGLPVIAWKFSFYEGLIMDGENGYLVKPNDTQEMCNKILGLLDDKMRMENMKSMAVAHVNHQYNWQTLSQKVLAVF
jgi:glycosyltransferase involved in cell wall biosynthesis